MPRIECPYEDDVLTMVTTGQWPTRASAELRAHAAECPVCADLALVAQAIGEDAVAPRLPGSGTVWWRAQLRARQDAAKESGRPITVAQAVLLAVAGGLAGAVFGATTGWFQRVLHGAWTVVSDAAANVHLPELPSLTVDSTTIANYSTGLLLLGIAAAVAMAVVVWALREE